MPLFFCIYSSLYNTVDTFIHHSFINIRISMSSQLSAQWAEPPWGAEPRFELGPALQQASALPTKPRCTLVFLHLYILDMRTGSFKVYGRYFLEIL
jgi:hypothetical protein